MRLERVERRFAYLGISGIVFYLGTTEKKRRSFSFSKMTSQIFRYEFVCHQVTDTKEVIKSWCESVANKWAFQLEQGAEAGKLHYQGFVGLKKKQRKVELIKTLPEAINETSFRPVGDENAIVKYVTKCDTRVEGPWTSENMKDKVPAKRKWADEDVEEDEENWMAVELRPWQEKVWELLQTRDNRTIHWVYNPVGNEGKSFFTKWASIMHGVLGLTFGKASDLKYLVSKFKKRAYIFDLARNATVEMAEIYNALEDVKNGNFISTKYEVCQVTMKCPSIVVFSNHKPDLSALSNDRWKVWSIVDDNLV